MSTLWTPRILSNIALRIRTDDAVRFWDEDEQGDPQELGNDNIIRYLNDFLPSIGIWTLPEEGAKGIPELALVFFFENRVEKINAQQFETVIRKVLQESGYARVNEMMHFVKRKFFGKDVVLSIPSLENRSLLRDDRSSSYKFFANGYVKVTSDKVTAAIPYSSLPENTFIWNDLVSTREYRPSDHVIRSGERHYRDFVVNLARDPDGEFNEQSFERIQIALGYLCHRYNKSSERKCIILMDRLDDASLIGQSNGGTGRSILVQSLFNILDGVNINGKEIKSNNIDRFAFAQVKESHELVNFEDSANNFDFERIFPHITGDFYVRRIGKDPITIPSDKAPKIVLSTNRPIGDSDFSTRRRQFLVELSPYYRHLLEEEGKTPADVHGGMELCRDEWSDHDWNEFYQFIFECIQIYLKKGLPKHNEESENYKRAQLIRRCGSAEMLDALLEILDRVASSGEEWFSEQFYGVIRSAVPQCRQTDTVLLGLLKDVAEANGYLFNPHKNGLSDKQRLSGERWNRWVALGLKSVSKKSGGHYQKDDRVSVFRISREGSESVKNALELLLEQS